MTRFWNWLESAISCLATAYSITGMMRYGHELGDIPRYPDQRAPDD